MLIAQISDCHITAPGGRVADRVDPSVGLRRALALINEFTPAIELVVATGDLVNDARSEEYDELESILAELDVPLLPLPGNHDDRSAIRRRFDAVPAGEPDQPIDHIVELEACRVVCLDTTIPGQHGGRLDSEQLAWLDGVLADAPEMMTIIAQHHPPIRSGIPAMDIAYGLDGAAAEAEVLSAHRNVGTLIAGHYHRTIYSRFAGTVVSCCPSTAVQLALDFDVRHAMYCDEPTGFLLHRIDPEPAPHASVSTHLVPIVDSHEWIPSWARPMS